MLLLVAVWALAEAVGFVIVADVAVMAIGLRHGWRRGLVAAVLASLMAAMGGVAVLVWSASQPDSVRALYLALPGISPALFDAAVSDYAARGMMAMLAGSFAGVPYKLYAHAAGLQGTGWAAFPAMSVAARLPRFALVGLVSGLAGPWLRQRLRSRALWTLFALAWVVFYAGYFAAMG